MPISPHLQRFVDDELGLSRALVGRVLAGTMQLLGFNDSSLGASERAQYADALKALQRSANRYEEAFVENLRRIVADEIDDLRDPSSAEIGTGLGGLQLMDESRVEIDIELSRAMQLIDTTAEWELRELQMFTSTLTGQRHVSSDSNPLRPLVYAKALWEAASVATPAHAQRALILRTSAGVAAGLLKNAWAAAATQLESQLRLVEVAARLGPREQQTAVERGPSTVCGCIAGMGDEEGGIVAERQAIESLTANERSIIRLIAEGQSNAQVAELLHLSPRTVETYRARLMQKLQLEDLVALVKFAIRNGMSSVD